MILKRRKKSCKDIRQTASTALNEVRELVTDMRATKIEDELIRIAEDFKGRRDGVND